jgi:hypothetical protein
MTDLVERLRGWSELHDWQGKRICTEAAAEIERLRGQVQSAEEHFSLYSEWIAEKDAEIERLRAEVEPLHIALGLLTTIKPTMEIDIADPVGMAQQIAAHSPTRSIGCADCCGKLQTAIYARPMAARMRTLLRSTTFGGRCVENLAMTDLVEKLRRRPAEERQFSPDGITFTGMGRSLEHQAADEIERLRGLLREWLADAADTDELMTSGDLETLVERTRMAISVRQSNNQPT